MITDTDEKIDLVYTWVDDQFEGYQSLLNKYSKNKHDTNPNRTRDNLQILKYSLRSVADFLPWINNIYIVSCRPQIPEWLNTDHPQIKIVHHDEIMSTDLLPTFNSFSIVSHLHHIRGLSERFLYYEDDYLVARPFTLSSFISENNKPLFYPQRGYSSSPKNMNKQRLSPWNRAVANANDILNQAYGEEKRHKCEHMPLLIDRSRWTDMIEKWSEHVEFTRKSKFRETGNVPLEYLYPYYMLNEDKGEFVEYSKSLALSGYMGLENIPFYNDYMLNRLNKKNPIVITLNDNFGLKPRAKVVSSMRRYLESKYSVISKYEKHCE